MFWYYYLNPILIAAAVIPAVALLVKVYRADRLERESWVLLISLVIGGVIATALAKVTVRAGDFLLNLVLDIVFNSVFRVRHGFPLSFRHSNHHIFSYCTRLYSNMLITVCQCGLRRI